MNRNFSQKCAIACQFISFINREDFREQFIYKKNENELTEECREFLEICLSNENEFYNKLNKKEMPEELKKFIK